MKIENNKSEKIQVPKQQEKKPNETGGFYFSSMLKIFDPNTNTTLVQVRGDN